MIRVRKASLADMYCIYEISNDVEVRNASFLPEIIRLEKHQQWFQAKLSDNNCLFLVAETDGKVVGQLRFDIIGETATVSLSVDPNSRGLNVGGELLWEGISILKRDYVQLTRVRAFIKEKNHRSLSFFQRNNFQYESRTTINEMPALEYVLKL